MDTMTPDALSLPTTGALRSGEFADPRDVPAAAFPRRFLPSAAVGARAGIPATRCLECGAETYTNPPATETTELICCGRCDPDVAAHNRAHTFYG